MPAYGRRTLARNRDRLPDVQPDHFQTAATSSPPNPNATEPPVPLAIRWIAAKYRTSLTYAAVVAELRRMNLEASR